MSSGDDSTVLGVVVLVRNGDRTTAFEDPNTYALTESSLTALGEAQQYQLGSLLRSMYLDPSSSSFIIGATPMTEGYNPSQFEVWVNGANLGDTMEDSALALAQGVWPPMPANNITLANGTTIVSPLGGYQYAPPFIVDPDESVVMEGVMYCTALDAKIEDFYNSDAFAMMFDEAADFLANVEAYVPDQEITLANVYNIYDNINVQNVHNATFAANLPSTYLDDAFTLASWHEANINSDYNLNGIGNIAGRVMLPTLFDAFEEMSVAEGLKMLLLETSYIPFLSIFNMTGVVADNDLAAQIVGYAGAVALELRMPSSSDEPVVRFNYKSSADDPNFIPYAMSLGGWNGNDNGDMPLRLFIDSLVPAAINNTADWCNACGQTTQRGCAQALATVPTSPQAQAQTQYKLNPVDAGVLGAGLTAAVMLIVLGALVYFGLASFAWLKPVEKSAVDEKPVKLDSASDRSSIIKVPLDM